MKLLLGEIRWTERWPWLILGVWCTLIAPPLSTVRGGIVLDTVADASYTSVAAAFPASGRLLGGPVGPGSGTLIDPFWVLSVGHVREATVFQPGGTGPTYNVAQVYYHPTFVQNGYNLSYGFDIALYRLSTPVLGVTPATLYAGTNEVGQELTTTGFGVTGVGSSGVAVPQPPIAHRAGTNTIDSLLSFSNGPMLQIGAVDSAFLSDFDAPNGIGGPGQYNTLASFGSSASITPLEYQVAAGDSGGGVYVLDNGQYSLAGLNSGVLSQLEYNNATGNPGVGSNNRFGYGGVAVYTRVSSYQSFIQSTLSSVPEPGSLLLALVPLTTALHRRRHRV